MLLRCSFHFLIIVSLIQGCTTQPPKLTQNVCNIFEEKKSWRKAARRSQKRWGIPLGISMAFIYQESDYQAEARPDRENFLWIIPCPICKRKSTSYGYAQAIDETWEQYVEEVGGWFPDRSDFDDAIDFIGWYNHKSSKDLGISKSNAKALYLAYHEGQNGYRKGTYKKKPWLIKVAKKVQRQANKYQGQYVKCK